LTKGVGDGFKIKSKNGWLTDEPPMVKGVKNEKSWQLF
jgi:hypothetical protein